MEEMQRTKGEGRKKEGKVRAEGKRETNYFLGEGELLMPFRDINISSPFDLSIQLTYLNCHTTYVISYNRGSK